VVRVVLAASLSLFFPLSPVLSLPPLAFFSRGLPVYCIAQRQMLVIPIMLKADGLSGYEIKAHTDFFFKRYV